MSGILGNEMRMDVNSSMIGRRARVFGRLVDCLFLWIGSQHTSCVVTTYVQDKILYTTVVQPIIRPHDELESIRGELLFNISTPSR